MKTAISMDDRLLRNADETARRLGVSRSRLFSMALSDFLESQPHGDMLARLNEVYGGAIKPAEKRLLNGIKARVQRSAR